MPIVNIKQYYIKKFRKEFLLHKLFKLKISLEVFFITLIIFGIPLNLFKNKLYDNSWTIGEWLISYSGGFVRRGLPGQIINFISSKYLISPILLVWSISLFAIISLAILILYFCKGLFDKYFLLSHLIILAPISEDYLVRKDSFLVLLYGLSLLTFRGLFQKKVPKIYCILFINFASIIAILSHESYGIWGLPSIFFIFFLFEIRNKKDVFKPALKSILFLMPTFLSFLLCWIFKGNKEQAMMIHQSWQSLEAILPSINALNEINPTGAIDAIGWGTSQIYTSSLISQFNLLIFWHPGMWLLTIFIVMRLFIGNKKDLNQKGKRIIICMQLISFLPMFLFVDIGRWIFMWLSSSAMLFALLSQTFGIEKILLFTSKFKGIKVLSKVIPAFNSSRNYKLILLLIGLPHCCWSVGRYIVSNPIGFSIKNIIFYFQLLSV